MMRKWLAASGSLLLLSLLFCAAPLAQAQGEQQQGQSSKTPYTLAEYNAFQAAAGQTDPNAKIQALNDFTAKFPNSVLTPLVDQIYLQTYNQLKDYGKVIEYADKFLAVPDEKIQVIPGMTKDKITGDRLQALYLRAVAFNQSFNDKDPNAQEELTKTRQSALEGVKVLGELAKPANMTDEQFAQQKKPAEALFDFTAGEAAYKSKDYKDAIESFDADLAASGNSSAQAAAVYFQIGVSYLQLAAQGQKQQPAQPAPPGGTPPTPTATADSAPLTDLYMNGFWALARSISLKGPGEAQMRSYLHAQMFNYEQPGCGALLDQQMNELIQLAGGSATRPTTYSIPSAADLGKILQSSTLYSILDDLQAGGDKAKMTWLAVCGQEIPNVVGKIIDVTPGTDSVDFKVFTARTGPEIQAGTTPNLDVVVWTAPHTETPASAGGTGAQTQAPVQPEAARLQKGDAIKFSGTLMSYDTQPFLLHFDKCQVDASVIPPEKKGGRRPRR